MTLPNHQDQRVFSTLVAWVRQRVHDAQGPWKGLRRNKPSKAQPTGSQLERLVAEVIGRTNVWGALRNVGIEPSNIPEPDREVVLEDMAVGWAARMHSVIPGLVADTSTIEMRVRLKWIDTTSIFTATNSLRSVSDRIQNSDELSDLDLKAAARYARDGVEAVARWAATVDVAAHVLGEGDPQVHEFRQKLDEYTSEFQSELERALPLLDEHGLAEGLKPDL